MDNIPGHLPEPSGARDGSAASQSVGNTVINTAMQAGRNGGQLKVGNPGNKGGGRIKEELRAELVECFELGIQQLKKRLYRDGMSTGELVRLVDLMGRYAIPYIQEGEPPQIDLEMLSDSALAELEKASRGRCANWIDSATVEELREWARKDAKSEPTFIVLDYTKETRLTDDERVDRVSELLGRANDRRQAQGESE